MKKVLFCSTSLKTGAGGVASYAQDFIRAFKNEYDFIVITSDDGKIEFNSGIKTIYLNALDWSKSNILRLLDIINDEKPQIIINSSFPLMSIATPFVPNPIKLITVSHFTDGPLAKRAGLNGEYVDIMIGLSTFAKSYLERYSKVEDKNKVKVVYNFMKVKEFPNITAKQNTKVLNIVYPGGSIYQKSADVVCKVLLKLLKTNLNFNFYWIGGAGVVGGRWSWVRTKSLNDILPSDNRIKRLGSVSREESQQLLANANVFLLPSRGEGFPISLIEAMRGCCIPVISDAKHGALDLIKNGFNGYITQQGNSDDLFRRLVYIIENHKKLSKIYQESYITFKTHLTEEVWKANMSPILEETNCHKERWQIELNEKLLRRGIRKMKEAATLYWLFDRFYKQPSMMFKYRFYRYIYRHLI